MYFLKTLARISLLSLLLASCGSNANKPDELPNKAYEIFKLNYPEVTDENWSLEKSIWASTFEYRDTTHILAFDQNGQFLYLKKRLVELPLEIVENPKFNFTSSKIEEIWMVQTNAGTQYELFLVEGEERLYVFIDHRMNAHAEGIGPASETQNIKP